MLNCWYQWIMDIREILWDESTYAGGENRNRNRNFQWSLLCTPEVSRLCHHANVTRIEIIRIITFQVGDQWSQYGAVCGFLGLEFTCGKLPPRSRRLTSPAPRSGTSWATRSKVSCISPCLDFRSSHTFMSSSITELSFFPAFIFACAFSSNILLLMTS